MKETIVSDDGVERMITWGDPITRQAEAIDREGIVVAGWYLGCRQVGVAKTETREAGTSTIHRVKLVSVQNLPGYSRGVVIEFWGSALLDSVLTDFERRVEKAEEVPHTALLVRIEYKGREGDKGMKIWDVRAPKEVKTGRSQ